MLASLIMPVVLAFTHTALAPADVSETAADRTDIALAYAAQYIDLDQTRQTVSFGGGDTSTCTVVFRFEDGETCAFVCGQNPVELVIAPCP